MLCKTEYFTEVDLAFIVKTCWETAPNNMFNPSSAACGKYNESLAPLQVQCSSQLVYFRKFRGTQRVNKTNSGNQTIRGGCFEVNNKYFHFYFLGKII